MSAFNGMDAPPRNGIDVPEWRCVFTTHRGGVPEADIPSTQRIVGWNQLPLGEGQLDRRQVLIAIAAFVGLTSARQAGAQSTLQPKRTFRIGFLSPFSSSETTPWYSAFRQGLRDTGWIEGKNIAIEYRCSDSRDDLIPNLVADLVRL